MSALAYIALGLAPGFIAGVHVARWAVRVAAPARALRDVQRAEDRTAYAFHRLDVAERDALRWKLRALRRGWKPWR